MDNFGPIYCDTQHVWWFFHEPVNTLTNFAIIFAAVIAYVYIRRNTQQPPVDALMLAALTVMNGVGSLLWHGLRAPWALPLDVVPAVLFVFLLAYAWARRMYGIMAGVGITLAFVVLLRVSDDVGSIFNLPFPVPIFGSVLLIGLVLVYLTWRRYGVTLARFAAGVLAIGLAAAVFRVVDLSVCAYIPFGTHFMWHILLALGAFMSAVFLVRLSQQR